MSSPGCGPCCPPAMSRSVMSSSGMTAAARAAMPWSGSARHPAGPRPMCCARSAVTAASAPVAQGKPGRGGAHRLQFRPGRAGKLRSAPYREPFRDSGTASPVIGRGCVFLSSRRVEQRRGDPFRRPLAPGTSLFRLSSLYGSFPGGMAAQAPGFPSIKRLHSLRSFKSALRRRFFLNEALLPACFLPSSLPRGGRFSRSGEGLASFFAAGYACALKICYPGHPA